MEKIRLKRHESFPLREGWFEKGLNLLDPENPGEMFRGVNGIRELGIGANMVKSLRYWMESCNLLTHYRPGRSIEFTPLAKVILKYDPFFEKEYTWWILHYYLATNKDDAPIIYFMFNQYSNDLMNYQSSKDKIIHFLSSYGEFNEKFVESDFKIFLNTYALDEERRDPEENIVSPFSKLKLLKKYKGKDVDHEFLPSEYKDFFAVLLYFFLFQHYSKDATNDLISFDINEAFEYEGSPARIFRIEKGMYNQYLTELRNLDLITLNRTAGLNTAYFNQDTKDKLESIEDIYKYLEDK